jgi:arabinofuranosyltransferase
VRRAWLPPAVVALAARWLTRPHPIDDAYITFRYARNLAEGLGLVYNPGEWVLGTTTPLWAAILALGYRLGFTDLAAVATGVSAACDAVTAGLLASLALRFTGRWPVATVVGLAWALNPMSIAFAVGGMETSLFVLACVATLSLTAWGRYGVLAAGLAGLSALTRPEGLLLCAVVVGWPLVNRRRLPLGSTLMAAAPVLGAGVLLASRYGSPLPHSLAAKQVAYQGAWPLTNAVALVMQAGLPGWSTYLLASVPAAVGLPLALLGCATLAYLVRLGLPWLTRHGLAWQPFVGFAVLYSAFYALVGLRGVRLFPWYLVPLVPFYLLGAAAGLTRLGGARAAWLAAAVLVWQLPAIDWQHGPLLPSGSTFWREAVLLDVGHELSAALPGSAVVAAPEIGALGYASNLRILDTVGLVSPAALPYYPLPAEQLATDNAIPPRLIADQKPDAVVTMDAFAERSLLRDPDFLATYRLARIYDAPVWASSQLLVFMRRDGATP